MSDNTKYEDKLLDVLKSGGDLNSVLFSPEGKLYEYRWVGDIRLTIEKNRTKAEGNDNDNDA